jgi:colanic acid/amylovoran biosynthesis glycosyltransferase
VNELAAALEFMLNERTLWKTYTIAARQKVEQYFDSNQQLLLQAKYYDELLGNRGTVRRH